MLLKHLANVLIYVSYHLKVEERINSNRTLRPAKTKLCATFYEINDKAGNVAQWQTASGMCEALGSIPIQYIPSPPKK